MRRTVGVTISSWAVYLRPYYGGTRNGATKRGCSERPVAAYCQVDFLTQCTQRRSMAASACGMDCAAPNAARFSAAHHPSRKASCWAPQRGHTIIENDARIGLEEIAITDSLLAMVQFSRPGRPFHLESCAIDRRLPRLRPIDRSLPVSAGRPLSGPIEAANFRSSPRKMTNSDQTRALVRGS